MGVIDLALFSMAKLNTKTLQALTEANIGDLIIDDGGLRGKVRPNTSTKNKISVIFYFRYKWETKTKELSCGTWPATTMPDIRKVRDTAREKIRQGFSPVIERQTVLLQNKTTQSEHLKVLRDALSQGLVRDLFNQWHGLELKNRKDGGNEAVRYFNKDILPAIGHISAKNITKAHIMSILDSVVSRGSSRMARVYLSEMRQMFGFALDRDIVTADPTARIKKYKIGEKEEVRTRTLSELEIVELKNKLPDGKFMKTTEIALWLMLSTCCRVGELSKAKWQDINLADGVWVIPAANSKNKKPHAIYLSDFAKSHFENLMAYTSGSIWAYPNNKNTSHVCIKSISKQVGDRQINKPIKGRTKAAHTLLLAGGKFTPHDLRRTGATMMGRLRVAPEVIEKCLNHTEENKLKKTYQQQELIVEQRQAWQDLGVKLELILNQPINVILMRQA